MKNQSLYVKVTEEDGESKYFSIGAENPGRFVAVEGLRFAVVGLVDHSEISVTTELAILQSKKTLKAVTADDDEILILDYADVDDVNLQILKTDGYQEISLITEESLGNSDIAVYSQGSSKELMEMLADIEADYDQASGLSNYDSRTVALGQESSPFSVTGFGMFVAFASPLIAILGHNDKNTSAMTDTIVRGEFTGGEVHSDNDLVAQVFSIDGRLLGESSVSPSGVYEIQIEDDYVGLIVVQVYSSGLNLDYLDEGTNLNTDLDSTNFRAVTYRESNQQLSVVNVNALTEIAARELFNDAGVLGNISPLSQDFSELTRDQVVLSNLLVAQAFNLIDVDIISQHVVSTNSQRFGSAHHLAQDYGHVLAALSGIEQTENINTNDALMMVAQALVDGHLNEDIKRILDEAAAHIDSTAGNAGGTVDYFNAAPQLELISTSQLVEDDASVTVGKVVASYTAMDEENDDVMVELSDLVHYELDGLGNVILTQEGVDLVNEGSELPSFLLTPNDGRVNGNVVHVTPQVVAVNDPAIVSAGETLVYTEGDAAAVIDANLIINDEDNIYLESAVITISEGFQVNGDVLGFIGTDNIQAEYDSEAGVLTLTGRDTVENYQAALRSVTYHNISDIPTTHDRTISWTVNDGESDSTAVTSEVLVTVLNRPANLTAGAISNYTEGDAATVIDANLIINDEDDIYLESATIAISEGFQVGEDILIFVATENIQAEYDPDTGVLTLTGRDTLENYQIALRSVSYQNLSNNPTTHDRTISWTVNDGESESQAVTSTMVIIPVNDPAIVSAGETLEYTEGDAATVVNPDITITDEDDSYLEGATITISEGFQENGDVLSFADTANIQGEYNASTGVLTLIGRDTVENYQTALRSIMYQNVHDTPSIDDRTIRWQVNDGEDDSDAVLSTIDMRIIPAVRTSPVRSPDTFEDDLDGAIFVRVVDVDNDGDLDVVALGRERLLWYANDGSGNFGNGRQISNVTSGKYLTVGDLDGDGDTDLIVGDDNHVEWFRNDGAGNFTAQGVIFSVHMPPETGTPRIGAVEVSDLDGDGDLDVIAAELYSDVMVILINDGHGGFTQSEQFTVDFPSGISTGDFDNDGDIDIVVSEGVQSRIKLYSNNGHGQFTYQQQVNDDSGGHRTLVSADFDGDGNLDILAAKATSDEVVWYKNDGAGGWELNPIGDNLDFLQAIAVDDLDGDGDIDVLAAPTNGNRIVWFENDGSGNFGEANIIEDYIRAPSWIAPGDFDQDGDPDVVMSARLDDELKWYELNYYTRYFEGMGPVVIDDSIRPVDRDDTHLEGAIISISEGFHAGQDVLSFVAVGNIQGMYDSDTGVLTLQGIDTIANYRAVLRSVTYNNISNNPSHETREISWLVNDGNADSMIQTSTIVFSPSITPVVLDLDGDGFNYYSDGVMFDTDGDGVREQTAWVGEGDGLLAYDKDSNGQISETDEIEFTSYLEGAQTDLEGLMAFDDNGNGLLDAGDREFDKFVIWQDFNLDGISDEGELFSLSDMGIESINLSSDGNQRNPAEGVHEYGQGMYTLTDGSVGVLADVAFSYKDVDHVMP